MVFRNREGNRSLRDVESAPGCAGCTSCELDVWPDYGSEIPECGNEVDSEIDLGNGLARTKCLERGWTRQYLRG